MDDADKPFYQYQENNVIKARIISLAIRFETKIHSHLPKKYLISGLSMAMAPSPSHKLSSEKDLFLLSAEGWYCGCTNERPNSMVCGK